MGGMDRSLEIYSAEGDQNIQNEQVLRLIGQGVDVLCVNPVDRTSAVYLIRLARQHDIPLVLFNREPLAEDQFRSSTKSG